MESVLTDLFGDAGIADLSPETTSDRRTELVVELVERVAISGSHPRYQPGLVGASTFENRCLRR